MKSNLSKLVVVIAVIAVAVIVRVAVGQFRTQRSAGNKTLMDAVKKNDATAVEAALKNSADPNAREGDGEEMASIGENSQTVLAEIDAALARIDAGTYGTCTKCGKQIAVGRLEAHPWASLCIDDARLG